MGFIPGVVINIRDCHRQGGTPRNPGLHQVNDKVNDEVNTLCQKRCSNCYATPVKKHSLAGKWEAVFSVG